MIAAALREAGHLTLVALPGLLPLLPLPVLRSVLPSAVIVGPRRRAVAWAGCATLSFAALALAWVLRPVDPDPARIPAIIVAALLSGGIWVLSGGDAMAATIDRANRRLLALGGLLALASAVAMIANVLLRYVFATGFGWARETVIYCYAACFMLAAAGTLGEDGHVRIDILRERMPPHWRARIELLGCFVFLLPVMLLILYSYAPQLGIAWGAGSGRLETSDEGDGLPLAFAFKTLIPIFAMTMIAQGWSIAWKAGAAARAGEDG